MKSKNNRTANDVITPRLRVPVNGPIQIKLPWAEKRRDWFRDATGFAQADIWIKSARPNWVYQPGSVGNGYWAIDRVWMERITRRILDDYDSVEVWIEHSWAGHEVNWLDEVSHIVQRFSKIEMEEAGVVVHRFAIKPVDLAVFDGPEDER